MLYAKNIGREEGEQDDEVKARVRKYVQRKRDVRIVSVQVVHNKYCEDTVGCKLCIPVSAVEVLMAPGFWPEDVECREWSRKRPTDNGPGRGGRRRRDREDDARNYDDSAQDYSDRGYTEDRFPLRGNDGRLQYGDQDRALMDCWRPDDVREHRVDYTE